MSFAAVVPARWGSGRFPGKPLVKLGGVPMIVRTAARAALAEMVERVVVATDDRRIAEVCDAYGFESVMTRNDHPTGTDRVVEAGELLGIDRVVNVQGDEPLIEPATIDAVIGGLDLDPEAQVANAGCPLSDGDLENPNVAKAVVDQRDRLLYISRFPLPYSWGERVPRLRHLGLYAFRGDALKNYARYKQGPLELSERIEMFRFIEQGDPIILVQVPIGPPAVDTPADVDRIDQYAVEHDGWPEM
jgi:3-deoxy-manno-octulosonate cytidylyltransferase (CMP-KDO synthetase)